MLESPRILSQIHIYPIKSLGGIALQEAQLTPFGLANDRRFMLVDEAGVFLTQRNLPNMTHFGTAISGQTLTVFLKNSPAEKIDLPLQPSGADFPKIQVQVWNDKCSAQVMADDVNRWFSERFGQNLRLVFMPDDSRRATDPEYAPDHQVSFADGYPMLLLGQASLDELNRRLAAPLPMNRFRPNLVFTGGQAHEEDDYQRFTLGAAGEFWGVKPCARCIIPTTDQDSGERSAEPLQTLATYRQFGRKILFGQNVVWLGGGTEATIRVGDLLQIERRLD